VWSFAKGKTPEAIAAMRQLLSHLPPLMSAAAEAGTAADKRVGGTGRANSAFGALPVFAGFPVIDHDPVIFAAQTTSRS
jgi:hypothetical protein